MISLDIPVWPWNRHKHRCIDCGFLADLKGSVGPGYDSRHVVQLTVEERRASLVEARRPTCWLGIYYLDRETKAVRVNIPYPGPPNRGLGPDELEAHDIAQAKEDKVAATTVTTKSRPCQFYEKLQPGLSADGHQSLHLRRIEFQHSLLATSLGGMIAAMGSAVALLLT